MPTVSTVNSDVILQWVSVWSALCIAKSNSNLHWKDRNENHTDCQCKGRHKAIQRRRWVDKDEQRSKPAHTEHVSLSQHIVEKNMWEAETLENNERRQIRNTGNHYWNVRFICRCMCVCLKNSNKSLRFVACVCLHVSLKCWCYRLESLHWVCLCGSMDMYAYHHVHKSLTWSYSYSETYTRLLYSAVTNGWSHYLWVRLQCWNKFSIGIIDDLLCLVRRTRRKSPTFFSEAGNLD